MNHSDTLGKLANALAVAQPMIKTASMDSVNPFFKSKYADLGAVWDAVREALLGNGLAVSQFPDHIGQEPALTTMLIHASGEWISATYPLMVNDKDHTPQGFGSAITYARRYGLSSVLGVIADTDDDGNSASGRNKPTLRDAIHGASTLKPTVASEAYAPPHVEAKPVEIPKSQQETEAREWGEWALPRVKTMDKDRLDKFQAVNKANLATLKALDPKTSVELEKALADRLEVLFA